MLRKLLLIVLTLCPLLHASVYRGNTPSGAKYLLQTPDDWAPGKGLVIINHGFQFTTDSDDPSLGPAAVREHMLAQGYALAASSYSSTGWALFTTGKDTQELIGAVQQRLMLPAPANLGPLYVSGGSLGGLVSVQQLEMAAAGQLPAIAGALSMCPPLAGSRVWDAAIDFRVAYDVLCDGVFGGEISEGTQEFPWLLRPGLVDDGGADRAYVQLASAGAKCLGMGLNDLLQTNGMKARKAKLLASAKIKEDFLPQLLFYSTFALSDIVYDPKKLGGFQPSDTREVVFGADINAAIRRISADPIARAKLARNYTPTGAIGSAKLLTISTNGDDLVVPEHLRALEGKAPEANWRRALVKETNGSHCGFSDAELIASWDSLRDWTRGAAAPTPASLNSKCAGNSCRFDNAENLASLDTRIAKRGKQVFPNLNSEVNGDWYSVGRAGEGIKLEMLSNGEVLMSVFSYPKTGESAEQLWLVGTGKVEQNGVRFDKLYRTRGPRFGAAFNSSDMQLEVWGSAEFALSTCGEGALTLSGPAGYGSSTRKMLQLTRQSVPCYSRQAQQLYTGLSGSWFDPARSGEGVSVTIQNDGSAAILFHTYTPTGEQAWFAVQAPYSAGSIAGRLLQPVGTRFGTDFNSGNITVRDFGSVNLRFLSCDSLQFSYQTPWGGRSQTLQRIDVGQGAMDCQL
jgi:hypothetical protein